MRKAVLGLLFALVLFFVFLSSTNSLYKVQDSELPEKVPDDFELNYRDRTHRISINSEGNVRVNNDVYYRNLDLASKRYNLSDQQLLKIYHTVQRNNFFQLSKLYRPKHISWPGLAEYQTLEIQAAGKKKEVKVEGCFFRLGSSKDSKPCDSEARNVKKIADKVLEIMNSLNEHWNETERERFYRKYKELNKTNVTLITKEHFTFEVFNKTQYNQAAENGMLFPEEFEGKTENWSPVELKFSISILEPLEGGEEYPVILSIQNKEEGRILEVMDLNITSNKSFIEDGDKLEEMERKALEAFTETLNQSPILENSDYKEMTWKMKNPEAKKEKIKVTVSLKYKYQLSPSDIKMRTT